MEIIQLSTGGLRVKKKWSVPCSKRRCGWAFLCAGVFYFGSSYSNSTIFANYTLATKKFDETFQSRLPRGTYVSQMSWNPSTNVLFYSDNRHQVAYANIASRLLPSAILTYPKLP